MTSIQLIIIVAAFFHLVVEILLKFLDLKNTLKLKEKQPEQTVSLMNGDQWLKTSNYTIAKTKLSIFEDLFGFVLMIPIILFLFPWVFHTWSAASFNGVFSCAFISVAFLMALQLPGLILDWYKQFQLEAVSYTHLTLPTTPYE